MEEIYKPEHTDRIETYDADNLQDMLGDLPGWLIYTGSYLVYGLIALLLIGSAVFPYPDVVRQAVRIDEPDRAEWEVSPHPGVVDRLFAEDGARVKAGDTLGIFRNTASPADVEALRKVLANVERYCRTRDADYLRQCPSGLILGDMEPAYGQLAQATMECLMLHDFNAFSRKKRFLEEELRLLEESGEAGGTDRLKVKRELLELETGHETEQEKNTRMLELARENMANQMKNWESKYLIKCRNGGTVVWAKSWGTAGRVAEGDTLCTVLSERRGTPAGHIRLDETQVSEIAEGDKVSIALGKYPPHTYGKLAGVVASVSPLPHNGLYAVEVAFPDGLVTSNGQKIDCGIGLSGQAEIVTSGKTAISRIFGPIKQIIDNPWNKKKGKKEPDHERR